MQDCNTPGHPRGSSNFQSIRVALCRCAHAVARDRVKPRGPSPPFDPSAGPRVRTCHRAPFSPPRATFHGPSRGPVEIRPERWEEKGFLSGQRWRRVRGPHVAFHACSSADPARPGPASGEEAGVPRREANAQFATYGTCGRGAPSGIDIVPGEWASQLDPASPRTDNCFTGASRGERTAREVNDTQPVETLG